MPFPPPHDLINVVILYNELAAGDRAMALYAQLTRDLAAECQLALQLWRFDVAATAELASEFSCDLDAAELIIVAASGRLWSPPAFLPAPRPPQPEESAQSGVLVVLLEEERAAAPESAMWVDLLRPTFAQRQTNFLWWKPDRGARPLGSSGRGAGDTNATAPPAPEALVATLGNVWS